MSLATTRSLQQQMLQHFDVNDKWGALPREIWLDSGLIFTDIMLDAGWIDFPSTRQLFVCSLCNLCSIPARGLERCLSGENLDSSAHIKTRGSNVHAWNPTVVGGRDKRILRLAGCQPFLVQWERLRKGDKMKDDREGIWPLCMWTNYIHMYIYIWHIMCIMINNHI